VHANCSVSHIKIDVAINSVIEFRIALAIHGTLGGIIIGDGA